MSVYFVQAGKAGLIKIGCAQNVKQRLAYLQTHNHEKLRLISLIRGARPLEAELHHRFHAYRVRGEWFRLEGKLAEYVATLPVPPRPRSERQVNAAEALRRSWIGRGGSPLSGGDDVFWLTPAGARAVLKKGERLDPEDFPALVLQVV